MNEHGLTKENLLRSLPVALAGDPKMVALAEAIAEQLALRREEIERVSIYPHIDRLDGPLLDILARDFKVDWWDGDYTLEEKRRTLQSSWQVHRLLGTKAAVELAVSSVYPEATVEEWFKYDGDPFHFRLHVNLPDGQWAPDRHKQLLGKLQYYKNLRSHLDNISYFLPPVVLENKNRLFFVSQTIGAKVNNLGEECVYLNGSRSLDGSWQLIKKFTRGTALQSVNAYVKFAPGTVEQAAHGIIVFCYGAHNIQGARTGTAYRAIGQNSQSACMQETKAIFSGSNVNEVAGFITEKASRFLNGAFILNGAKTLNAGTTRSEL